MKSKMSIFRQFGLYLYIFRIIQYKDSSQTLFLERNLRYSKPFSLIYKLNTTSLTCTEITTAKRCQMSKHFVKCYTPVLHRMIIGYIIKIKMRNPRKIFRRNNELLTIYSLF